MKRIDCLAALMASLGDEKMNRVEFIKACTEALDLDVRRLAEIGVYRGKASQLFRNQYLHATLYLVDPWRIYSDYQLQTAGNVYRCVEPSRQQAMCERVYRKVIHRFRDDPAVRIVRAQSIEAAAEFGIKFDVVFLDANHSYEYVRADILAWLPLVREGGLLCGHDYKQYGGVRRAVDELLTPIVISGRRKGDVWTYVVDNDG